MNDLDIGECNIKDLITRNGYKIVLLKKRPDSNDYYKYSVVYETNNSYLTFVCMKNGRHFSACGETILDVIINPSPKTHSSVLPHRDPKMPLTVDPFSGMDGKKIPKNECGSCRFKFNKGRPCSVCRIKLDLSVVNFWEAAPLSTADKINLILADIEKIEVRIKGALINLEKLEAQVRALNESLTRPKSMIKKTVERWVNVYAGDLIAEVMHTTEEEAIAGNFETAKHRYIKSMKLTGEYEVEE
jgi:hypothetical protein